MNQHQVCGDAEQLVSYIYEECDDRERAAIERHLAACRQCADDVAGLRGVRLDLQGWTTPDVALGIRVGEEAGRDRARAWLHAVTSHSAERAGNTPSRLDVVESAMVADEPVSANVRPA